MSFARSFFLPVSQEDMRERGWYYYDFLLITGDAYVDHPSFGTAVIGRVLEAEGYRVAVLAQPDWTSPDAFAAMGRPRYGVLIGAGNLDSMVAHYTAAKKRRHDDAYSPGRKAGLRPDLATVVYSNRVREAFGDIPIVIGGLEASLRRFAHYDYWDDAVRPSILVESGADLLSFGMGERSISQIARAFAQGKRPDEMRDIRGICYLCGLDEPVPPGAVSCASFDKVRLDKMAYARASRLQLDQQDHVYGKAVTQKHGDRMLVQNPPAIPLTTRELARMITQAGMMFDHLPDGQFDELLGVSTGAATIFGASGGVMEAALRTVVEQLTGKGAAPLEYHEVRGMEGVKEASYELPGRTVRVCAASGLHNAKRVLDGVRSGKLHFDFIEIMACPGGCVNGGGQPIQHADVRNFVDLKALRAAALYKQDEEMPYRRSHENPIVQTVYKEYLGEPGGHKAHDLLHCTYIKQQKYRTDD